MKKRTEKNSNILLHRRGCRESIRSSSKAKRYNREKTRMNEKEWANEFNQKPIKSNNNYNNSSKTRTQKNVRRRDSSARPKQSTHTNTCMYGHAHNHTPRLCLEIIVVVVKYMGSWAHEHARERAQKTQDRWTHEVNATTSYVWRSLMPSLLPSILLHEAYYTCKHTRAHTSIQQPYSTMCTTIQWCVDTETRQRHS